MTAQINDIFRYRQSEYEVAGISTGTLFDPSLLNLKPIGTCSDCWRGYQAVFALSDSRIVLDTLHVNLREQGPIINGISPTEARDMFNNHYEGLNYPLEYTGGLLLGNDLILKLYIHRGFHPAWKYKNVVELLFDVGVLKQESDRSEQMAEIRRQCRQLRDKDDSSRMPAPDEIARFVERTFDHSYDSSGM